MAHTGSEGLVPSPVAPAPAKPLLRGVSHEVAAFAALAAWIVLALAAPGGRGRAAANVYGASLFTLFLVSALLSLPALLLAHARFDRWGLAQPQPEK